MDKNNKCRQLWLLQKGLEDAGSEKDTEGEKGGAGSEKIVALEAEETKDDKVAEIAIAKAIEKGKVENEYTSRCKKLLSENEAQLATFPRTRSIVKRIKGRRDRKEKKVEDYEVQKLSKKQRNEE